MRCAIIGAGMAGIAAARGLLQAGCQPVLFDKGQRPGGRMATRRLGGGTLDSGAQFFTAHHPDFQACIQAWQSAGLVARWELPGDGEYVRYRGTRGMNAVAREWASGLTIHTGVRIERLEAVARGWRINGEDFDAAILTPPVPQALELMGQREHPVLGVIAYEPCLAVLAIPAGPLVLPPASGDIAFLADNQAKGISAVAAVTLHATGAYSQEHWDDAEAPASLLRQAGISATEIYLHRWKYAKAVVVHGESCYREPSGPPLVYAGDGFAGPRVEGAVLSGWAAAKAIL
ncbi:MAG: FAD-dependent oxidoreductase [Bryobacteraceae bacterium]|nr:FAD-dependent oxidoreductase [Bryobacteraceae bacterium]